MDTLNGRRAKRSQRGAAAVEFALLLPVMLLIIGGIVDFGRAFFTQVELTNAAREGARAVIVGADGEARARAAMPDPLPSDYSFVPVVEQDCSAGAGSEARVTARVTGFDWYVLGPMMNYFGGTTPTGTLDSTAVMLCT